jgi:hypothetical protein
MIALQLPAFLSYWLLIAHYRFSFAVSINRLGGRPSLENTGNQPVWQPKKLPIWARKAVTAARIAAFYI